MKMPQTVPFFDLPLGPLINLLDTFLDFLYFKNIINSYWQLTSYYQGLENFLISYLIYYFELKKLSTGDFYSIFINPFSSFNLEINQIKVH